MNRGFPPSLASARAILEAVILAEDAGYWGRTAQPGRPLVYGWTQGTEQVVLHWSAECAVGPRDYDTDCNARLREIATRFRAAHGFVQDARATTGDTCGTMMMTFRPVLCS